MDKQKPYIASEDEETMSEQESGFRFSRDISYEDIVNMYDPEEDSKSGGRIGIGLADLIHRMNLIPRREIEAPRKVSL